MGRNGRPRAKLDWDEIQHDCVIHCTQAEIWQIHRVSQDTMDRHCKREHKMSFAEYYRLWTNDGKKQLRRMQWDAAQKGSVEILKLLGRTILGQSLEAVPVDDGEEVYQRPDSMRVNPEEVSAAKLELERRRSGLIPKNGDETAPSMESEPIAEKEWPTDG